MRFWHSSHATGCYLTNTFRSLVWWSSSTWMHTTSYSWNGCHLPGQVRNGEDSSVCPFDSPTDWACSWTGGGPCSLSHSWVGISGRSFIHYVWMGRAILDSPWCVEFTIPVFTISGTLLHVSLKDCLIGGSSGMQSLMEENWFAADLPRVWEVQHLPPWHQGGSVLWWCECQDPQGPVEKWVPSHCCGDTWPYSGSNQR